MARTIERILGLTLKAQSQAEAVLQRAGGALQDFLKIANEVGIKLPIIGRRTFIAMTAIAEGARRVNESNRDLSASLHMSEKAWDKYSH